MNRVWVTGNAGTGKTTLVGQLAESLQCESFSLDRIVWQSGWKKTPDELKRQGIERIVAGERWVIDGVNIVGQQEADLIVFLDLPRRVAILRALRRNRRYLFRSRPELPDGCPEILVLPKLLKIIWRFPTRMRPRILDAAAQHADRQAFLHVRSTRDQRELIKRLRAVAGDPDVVASELRAFATSLSL